MKLGNVQYPAVSGTMNPRDFSVLREIYFHHSAGNPMQTPLEIDAEERAPGTYTMIPYTFLIGKDGTIYKGRPIQFENAANLGRNAQSISVCVIGNFHPGSVGYSGHPSPQQVLAMMDLALHLHQTYPQIIRTIGHRDVAKMFYPDTLNPNDPEYGKYSTACPGDNLYELLPALRQYVQTKMKLPKTPADIKTDQELK